MTSGDLSTLLYCGIVLVFALAALYAVVHFGEFLARQTLSETGLTKAVAASIQELGKLIRDLLDQNKTSSIAPLSHNLKEVMERVVGDSSRERSVTSAGFYERRNDFWTMYLQVVVACVVITVLAVLLLTKTITAEAGLPILSAISGFAVAKSVSNARMDRPEPPLQSEPARTPEPEPTVTTERNV